MISQTDTATGHPTHVYMHCMHFKGKSNEKKTEGPALKRGTSAAHKRDCSGECGNVFAFDRNSYFQDPNPSPEFACFKFQQRQHHWSLAIVILWYAHCVLTRGQSL